MTTATAPTGLYPTDDEVEAFYSDAPDGCTFHAPDPDLAEALDDQPAAESAVARLARLDRKVFEYRTMLDRQRRLNATAPEGELDEEDVWAEHSLALLHAHAWEQLAAARRELGQED